MRKCIKSCIRFLVFSFVFLILERLFSLSYRQWHTGFHLLGVHGNVTRFEIIPIFIVLGESKRTITEFSLLMYGTKK